MQTSEKPLISITIPTRNSAKTLRTCLESIKNQTFTNIETIIIDSSSVDDTLKIAQEYSAKILDTEWKLLGARYIGLENSKGDYILLLDSDQILYPDTLQRLVEHIQKYDMMCLEETSYNPETFLEKLFIADREVINRSSEVHLDPLEGVMLARFFRRSVLELVFAKIPIEKLHDIVAHDHAIIYYEAYTISSKVGLLRRAVMHKEPASLKELWIKNYRYGRTTRELINKNLYTSLLRSKTRFRKGTSFDFRGMKSLLLLVLKGMPYFIGLYSR